MQTENLPTTIDEYLLGFPPEIQEILQNIRRIVQEAAPDAQETISYRMPAFKLNGPLVYFAAFKKHIGLYPPVHGDDALEAEIAPYAGPKGNLQFPLDQPIPYDLIQRITTVRVAQNLTKSAGKQTR